MEAVIVHDGCIHTCNDHEALCEAIEACARLLAHSGAEGVNVGREPGAGALALLELLAAGLIHGEHGRAAALATSYELLLGGGGAARARAVGADGAAGAGTGRAGERRAVGELASVVQPCEAALRPLLVGAAPQADEWRGWVRYGHLEAAARGAAARSRCRSSCTCSRYGTSRRPWCCASRAGEGALVLGAAQRLRLQSKPLAEGGVAGGDGALLRELLGRSRLGRARGAARGADAVDV